VVVPMMPWITQSNAAVLINTANMGSATANQSVSTATTMATTLLTPHALTAPDSESPDATCQPTLNPFLMSNIRIMSVNMRRSNVLTHALLAVRTIVIDRNTGADA
jgi:hypothetical protein